MCADKGRAELVEDVRAQIVEYVGFRRRNGPELTYQQALLLHREQCTENLRDDPDGPWRDRLDWLDQLVSEEGLWGYLVEVAPDHLCDRCDHPSKYHAGPDRGSRCMIVDGKVWRGERVPKGMRAKQCLCSDYWPKP